LACPDQRSILGIASVAGFLALWELGAAAGRVNVLFFSSPLRIAVAGLREVQQERFWQDVQASSIELFAGYAAAATLGVLLGLVVGWHRRLLFVLEPWLSFMYALPRVALFPLIVLWLGLTAWSTVAAVFVSTLFTVVIGTLYGVGTVDARLLDVAASFGARRRNVFINLIVPTTLPFILSSLRLGVGQALVGVVIGERYAANAGIGVMMLVAGQQLQTDRLLFAIGVCTSAGLLLIEGLRLLERRLLRWRPSVASL